TVIKRAQGEKATTEPGSAGTEGEPRSAAVSFLTTEHFALQSARAMTVAESTGRATMFLGSVSGGLIALGPAQRQDRPVTPAVAGTSPFATLKHPANRVFCCRLWRERPTAFQPRSEERRVGEKCIS